MRKLAEGKSKIYEQLIEEGIITREQLVEVVTKDNELMSQTVPFNGGARLRPINSTKPNHEVGEVEKDYCIDCNVEIFDGGSWGYCTPCGNRVFDKLVSDKLKATNNTKPNHAVGEVYKPQAKLNTHDPENQYQWEDEGGGWFIWAMRALGAVGFVVGIYSLVFLGMLL